MAHFAELDNNNIVLGIIVVDNKDILDENGQEQEYIGINFLKTLFGQDKIYVQTSYNSKFRKQYAGIGFYYDHNKDIFIEKKPYTSWILDNFNNWTAPVPKPDETKPYSWDENDRQWFYDPGPQPYPSWAINQNTGIWEAPIAMPQDADVVDYQWDELEQSWIPV
jgi:hypothetical protein